MFQQKSAFTAAEYTISEKTEEYFPVDNRVPSGYIPRDRLRPIYGTKIIENTKDTINYSALYAEYSKLVVELKEHLHSHCLYVAAPCKATLEWDADYTKLSIYIPTVEKKELEEMTKDKLLAKARQEAEHWMGMAVYEVTLRDTARDERDVALWLLAEARGERDLALWLLAEARWWFSLWEVEW